MQPFLSMLTPEPCRSSRFRFFTEYERNGFVYRAHPKYRGESAYYDWAYVKWVIGTHPVTNADICQPYPARILGFFQHPDGEVKAVVHSVKEPPRNKPVGHGVFGHYWQLEFQGTENAKRPLLHIVSVDSLLEHVCMIPYSDMHPFVWIHIWHPRTWSDCFHTILEPGQEQVIIN
jgi:hypothetical protein